MTSPLTVDTLVALVSLSAMEIVLGIDNVSGQRGPGRRRSACAIMPPCDPIG